MGFGLTDENGRMAHLSTHTRSVVRFFAFFVGNGTLGINDVFSDYDGDYRDALLGTGSDLEGLFSIFVNVLDVDEQGRVTNEADAGRRAAQWWRSQIDSAYLVDPPFAEWELELPM